MSSKIIQWTGSAENTNKKISKINIGCPYMLFSESYSQTYFVFLMSLIAYYNKKIGIKYCLRSEGPIFSLVSFEKEIHYSKEVA